VIPAVAIIAVKTVRPMSPYVVTLCARFAHLRPVRTILSNWLSSPRFARAAAARNRAIFCCGVSFAGTGPAKLICGPGRGAEGFEEKVGLLEA